MYPAGWKHTGIYNSGSASATISTFANELEAPTEFQICCEGAQFVLFSWIHQAGNLSGTTTFQIYGTQTNGESTQNVDYCFNNLLASPTIKTNENCITGMNIPDLPGLTEMHTFDSSTANFASSGVEDDTSSANEFSSVHFWNRIAGNQTVAGYIDEGESARSADAPSGDKYWAFLAGANSTVGPCWLAVPAGPFNYIQLRMSAAHSDNSSSILYNVLY
mgnify:FL=1|tara:strand:+ start:46 stop:702 length:657 start_codon:yes stop_codon:yes gene_type:complete